MSSLSMYLSSKGSLAIIFLSTAGMFAYVDRKMASPAVRADFSRYLERAEYLTAFGLLPSAASRLFELIFAENQLSWKCLRRSITLSLLALCICYSIAFMENPQAQSNLLAFKEATLSDLNPLECCGGLVQMTIVTWLSRVTFLCVTDYLMLWKTRLLIHSIGGAPPKYALIALFLVDFCSSWFMSALGLGVAAATFPMMPRESSPGNYDWTWQNFVADIWAILVYNLDPHNLSEQLANIDFGSFFFASLAPPFWFWMYISATILTKLLTRLSPAFSFLTYALPVKTRPIEATGYVVATIVTVGYAVVFVIRAAIP